MVVSDPGDGATDGKTTLWEMRELVAQQGEQLAVQAAEIATLRAELAEVRRSSEGGAAHRPDIHSGAGGGDATGRAWSRRALLLGGVGVAAGAAASVAGAVPAAATTGTMRFGDWNLAEADTTLLASYNGLATLQLLNNASTGAALYAGHYFEGPAVVAVSHDGPAAVLSTSEPASGPPATGTFARGALYAPKDGSLWWCVEAGTPGKWRLVASKSSASSFFPVEATRVWDSRWFWSPWITKPGRKIEPGEHQDLPVADGRNLTTGTVTVPNLVPQGAVAVALNLGVTQGNGPGWVALAKGGAATYTASAINFQANQSLANGLVAAINPATRSVRVFVNTSAVHVFMDVMGYYM